MKRIALVALFLGSAFPSAAQNQTTQTSGIVPVNWRSKLNPKQ